VELLQESGQLVLFCFTCFNECPGYEDGTATMDTAGQGESSSTECLVAVECGCAWRMHAPGNSFSTWFWQAVTALKRNYRNIDLHAFLVQQLVSRYFL
jgi:hypothetical protein